METSNLTSYSPIGIKPWGAASKEKLVQESMNAFGKVGNKFAVSSTPHNYKGRMISTLCERA